MIGMTHVSRSVKYGQLCWQNAFNLRNKQTLKLVGLFDGLLECKKEDWGANY